MSISWGALAQMRHSTGHRCRSLGGVKEECEEEEGQMECLYKTVPAPSKGKGLVWYIGMGMYGCGVGTFNRLPAGLAEAVSAAAAGGSHAIEQDCVHSVKNGWCWVPTTRRSSP